MGIIDGLKRMIFGATDGPVEQPSARAAPQAGMQVMNKARMTTFEENADVVLALRWLGTLDSHICISCAVRDGKTWETVSKKPIGHDIPWSNPPLHMNCRCAIVPVTKASSAPGGARASCVGPVDRSTTFSDFLNQQGQKFAESVLGITRAELFLSGKFTLQQLVDEFAWGNNDIIAGLEFCATLQLRTPLRVLLRHGEIHTERTKQPPQFAREMWEGIWLPKTSLSEMPPPDKMASDVGPVLACDYLPFLIAVRKIVELNDSIEQRLAKLREMLADCGWQDFISKHGGIEEIVQYFFLRDMPLMPTLPASALKEFVRLGFFEHPSRLAAATDEELLGLKGIGPAKLKAIRKYCADMEKHRDADRIENVTR